MSYEPAIRLPIIETSVSSDRKDLHFHIDVRLGAGDVACVTPGKARTGGLMLPTHQQLGELASKIYDARRTRAKVLDADLFGEPAWDILLALYCLPARGERLSLTALSLAADLRQSTGHRWQQILVQRELIEQVPDAEDGRRIFVELTKKGRELLELYLTRLFRCDNPFAS